jgi:hydroxylamine reductase
MQVGKVGVDILASLDGAHTAKFGAPTPTPVNHAAVEGHCVLISGHDLVDLEALLEQTAGKGVNVFTHGEMLPAHGYPGLKKHAHLKGHFGTAWQLQKMEYAAFPGPIVQTTNCLVGPRKSYADRLFTINTTGFPGVAHIGADRDFSAVIAKALAMPGFPATKPPKTMLAGFGHAAVLSYAPAVLDAVAKGQLERFVLIGGCDGSESDRSYYTKLAVGLPDSSIILTLGCAKYRVLGKKDYGVVPGTGLPRVLCVNTASSCRSLSSHPRHRLAATSVSATTRSPPSSSPTRSRRR